MMPVRPPSTRMKKKASTNSSGVLRSSRPLHSVASQQKIWMAEGMAIARLEAVKKPLPSSGRLVANMWWTHRPKARKASATSDSTIAV